MAETLYYIRKSLLVYLYTCLAKFPYTLFYKTHNPLKPILYFIRSPYRNFLLQKIDLQFLLSISTNDYSV